MTQNQKNAIITNKILDMCAVWAYYFIQRSVVMNTSVKTDLGNKEIFARNLSKYISESGKSKREIAKDLGVSPSGLCDWTAGRAYPRIDKIQLLAEYFGIKKSDLVENEESVPELDQRVLDIFHKVPEGKEEYALSLFEAVVNNL